MRKLRLKGQAEVTALTAPLHTGRILTQVRELQGCFAGSLHTPGLRASALLLFQPAELSGTVMGCLYPCSLLD